MFFFLISFFLFISIWTISLDKSIGKFTDFFSAKATERVLHSAIFFSFSIFSFGFEKKSLAFC